MDEVLSALRSEPVELASVPASVPAEPGLYAWWASFGAVPGISGPRHPVADVQLLYVGIAPNSAASKATLRSRVVGDHIRGTTGESTLRRSLAALLSEQQGWRSRWTSRPVLVNRDELRLSEWMGERLRLSWAVHPEPWTLEAAVIAELEPPLNQADDSAHPLYEHVRDARRRWREAAKTAGSSNNVR
ncbi:GIY-YIG nuclease family protein [Modestobacter sp. NPDC049651]|uniref:GIY-YIG nuclease family protein n=1 Tax=unclassified Modestobacter TaxID=2643866 RepID=UPI0033D07EC8